MWKAILCLIPVTALGLDLNPRSDIKVMEGMRIPVTSFDDPGHKIQWTPPDGWSMAYEKGILKLAPKNLAFAAMEMRVVPRVPGDRDALVRTETLLPYCAKFLPPLATKLTYKGTSLGAFTIGPIPAREFLVDFVEHGHLTRSSVCLLDYSDRQRLILVITAEANDFDAVRATAIESMFSWLVD